MFRRFWADDRGAVITVELILVLAILVFGIVPGLVALRNSFNAALGSLANAAATLFPVFSFSSVNIGGTPTTVAIVLPGSFTNNLVSSTLIPPIQVPDGAVLSPAPGP
jgi:hypothetical protein